jgi:hypothetical protein
LSATAIAAIRFPDLRGSSVYVRDSGDEVVIVSATKYDVKEVARHKRGKPYGYVISDTHKDPKHPNGPLLRHPIPTNKTEAKFLAISPTACVWLENAARIGAKGIKSSISSLVLADPKVAKSVIEESLYTSEFDKEFIIKLLDGKKKNIHQTSDIVPVSIGGSTGCYGKLLEVSHG